MIYEDFKNKYIYDVNIKELLWLKENSHINSTVFYGRMDYLIHKSSENEILDKIKILSNLFSEKTINIVTFYIKLYYENKSYNRANLLFDKFRYLIEELKYVEINTIFFNSNIYIDAFASLYQIFHDIEINVLKHSLLNSKNSYIRWHLHSEPMVREIDINRPKEFSLRYIIKHAENGYYEKALSLINDKNIIKQYNIPNLISIMYYKLTILKKLKLTDDIIQLSKDFNNFIEVESNVISDIWNITVQKIALFYIELYEYTKDIKHLQQSQFYFYKSFVAISNDYSKYIFTSRQKLESIFNNNFDNLKDSIENVGNLELIREYFLSILVYSYITGVKKNEFS